MGTRKSQETAAAGSNTAVAEAPANEETKVSKRQDWRNRSTVTLTEKGATNPKKPGSMSYDRYEILLAQSKAANGGAIAVDALFRAGYRMDDVRHDSSHGFISLEQPFEL
jgi:hypothetical protein